MRHMEARRALAQFVRDRPWLWDAIHPTYDWVRQRAKDSRIRRFADRLAPTDEAGQTLLGEAIRRGGPLGPGLGVGKIGGLEAEAAGFFLTRRPSGEPYPKRLRAQMVLNVGLFPDTDEAIDAFCLALIDAAGQMDVMGLMGYPGETEVVRDHAPQARLIPLRALDPWYFPDPWSRHLAGRRVTVVSPFADTIARQYAKREAIWPKDGPCRDVLPRFTLRTVRMPLSPGLRPPEEPDWQARLEKVRAAVDAEPYDVLLVGAGGISILLAAHAKRSGRIGFHMGGPTQVLFGVRGKRWDGEPFFQQVMNEAWTRPGEEETPPEAWRIEQGCYW